MVDNESTRYPATAGSRSFLSSSLLPASSSHGHERGDMEAGASYYYFSLHVSSSSCLRRPGPPPSPIVRTPAPPPLLFVALRRRRPASARLGFLRQPSGKMLPLLRHYCVFGGHHPSTWRSTSQTARRKQCHNGVWIAQCSASDDGTSVSDINGAQKDLPLPDSLLCDACILYCASPAMGHNKEAHPESNKRVPAIVDALEKLELTPKLRGSLVLEIQNFHPASLDDVARVHSRSYITGLEKRSWLQAMSRASDEGLIFIEGTGPTYATETYQRRKKKAKDDVQETCEQKASTALSD